MLHSDCARVAIVSIVNLWAPVRQNSLDSAKSADLQPFFFLPRSCINPAFHDTDTDTDSPDMSTSLVLMSDTRDFLARMSVSVSWNAGLTVHFCRSERSTTLGSRRPDGSRVAARLKLERKPGRNSCALSYLLPFGQF